MLGLREQAMSWKQPATTYASPRAVAHAKRLRKELTEPERRLWWHLRRRLPLDGTHFRRQVPIGPYVTDFCCIGARLIVEVDGGQHTEDHALAYDHRRTAHLESQGFRVLRFMNVEVIQ